MLFKKLIRTMGLYKAQFISMIIMIALGIGTFVGFNMEWFSLEKDTTSFMKDTGFADYRIVSEKGFLLEEAERVLSIEGVDEVSRFLSVNTLVKDDTDVVALNVSENINVSGFTVLEGEAYSPLDEDGFWLSDRYANKNGIALGDTLTLTYKAMEIEGRVKGLVKSGEYLICVPDETQLMPDYTSYGFLYASPKLLEKAFGAEYYTQINVLSSLEKSDFAEKADEALGKTLPIISRDDTISYSEAMGESEEGKTMGLILPVLFLAIAVLTMVTTMHRIAAAEKTQIGTLKALGFKDGRITRHYSFYAGMIGLLGTVFGLILGFGLGYFIMNPKGAMGTYLDMPSWRLHVPAFVFIVLVFINALLVLIGFLSVKTMLRGTAADALRPYTPKKMRHSLIEKTALFDKLSFGMKWNLRDCLRHKTRSLMTLLGVIGCMVLVLAALGMQDTMDEFMDTFYNKAIRYETVINLDTEKIDEASAHAAAEKYDGDTCAQSSVQLEGESVLLEVYNIEHDLVRFVSSDDEFIVLPSDGAAICERIAKKNGVSIGDTIEFSPFGTDRKYSVKVARTVRSLTESIMMSEEYAGSIGLEYTVNSVYTSSKNIEENELILNTRTKSSIIDSYDTFMEIMKLMIVLLIVAAVALGVVVLYNLGVMSYTERYREMATLKVIGFKDRSIGKLLIGQNTLLTLIGIAIGIPAGMGVLKYLLVALASEYELKMKLSVTTFVVSIALILGVSLIVSLMISRKNRRIDMVEALKGQD